MRQVAVHLADQLVIALERPGALVQLQGAADDQRELVKQVIANG